MDDKSKKAVATEGARLYDACALSQADMVRLANPSTSKEERLAASTPASTATTALVTSVRHMPIWDQARTLAFLACGVPNGVLVIPGLTFVAGRFVVGSVSTAFKVLAVALVPLVLTSPSFNPSSLQSWMAIQLLKYFSFRVIVEEEQPRFDEPQPVAGNKLPGSSTPTPTPPRPRILVAPPHGVFPYGNIMAMFVWPIITGHPFRGLAASSALRTCCWISNLKCLAIDYRLLSAHELSSPPISARRRPGVQTDLADDRDR
jgi:hypothetical protein